jgi:hypothetical protein
MPQMPPGPPGTKTSEWKTVAELIRQASILTSDQLANWAIPLNSRIVKTLRSRGLDGGNWRAKFLHGGDAQHAADQITEPLRAAAQDLYNCARNMTIFKRRLEVMFIEPIRQAEDAKDSGLLEVDS